VVSTVTTNVALSVPLDGATESHAAWAHTVHVIPAPPPLLIVIDCVGGFDPTVDVKLNENGETDSAAIGAGAGVGRATRTSVTTSATVPIACRTSRRPRV
jgi:hypothetical protein